MEAPQDQADTNDTHHEPLVEKHHQVENGVESSYDFEQKSERESVLQRLMTPFRILMFFTICNLLNYFDRGAIAATLPHIESEYDLSKSQSGVLAGAFMVGYMIFAPLFAHLSHTYKPTRLMAIGLGLWCVSALGAALSYGFFTLAISRASIGIGEASFGGLAPTCIDDVAPPTKRTFWLAVFYVAIPFGGALGYVVSGFITTYSSWRLVFVLEAALMLPFAIATYFLPLMRTRRDAAGDNATRGLELSTIVDNHPTHPSVLTTSSSPTFLYSLMSLLRNSQYVLITLGYTAYVFSLGAQSFWLPDYLVSYAGMPLTTATTGVGIVTIVCGIGGTAAGGWLNDALGGSVGRGGTARSLRLCAVAIGLSVPLGLAAFACSRKGPVVFFSLLAAMEFAGFATTGPVNAAIMASVPLWLRSFAMAMNIFAIHLLGDFVSPIIAGAIADATNEQYAMYFLALWYLWSTLLWGAGAILAWRNDSKVVEGVEVELEDRVTQREDLQEEDVVNEQ